MSDRPENPAHAALIARLLARADRAADILEPALSWAECHPASRASAIRKQKPVHRAFVVTFQALRCHADALRAIQHAAVLVGCDGFDDAADAAEIGLDVCMVRAGQAVEAVETAESRGRCGSKADPSRRRRADRLSEQVQALARLPESARSIAEREHNALGISPDRLARRLSKARRELLAP